MGIRHEWAFFQALRLLDIFPHGVLNVLNKWIDLVAQTLANHLTSVYFNCSISKEASNSHSPGCCVDAGNTLGNSTLTLPSAAELRAIYRHPPIEKVTIHSTVPPITGYKRKSAWGQGPCTQEMVSHWNSVEMCGKRTTGGPATSRP